MTSCMGDGSNSINYHRVGVIRENPMRCIYTADDQGNIFIVSSSEFENRTDLKDASGISFNVLAKMGRNEFVSMESLHKICLTLKCDVGDIMEFVDEGDIEQS